MAKRRIDKAARRKFERPFRVTLVFSRERTPPRKRHRTSATKFEDYTAVGEDESLSALCPPQPDGPGRRVAPADRDRFRRSGSAVSLRLTPHRSFREPRYAWSIR